MKLELTKEQVAEMLDVRETYDPPQSEPGVMIEIELCRDWLAMDAEIARLASELAVKGEYGYSQEVVNALTKERDGLRAENQAEQTQCDEVEKALDATKACFAREKESLERSIETLADETCQKQKGLDEVRGHLAAEREMHYQDVAAYEDQVKELRKELDEARLARDDFRTGMLQAQEERANLREELGEAKAQKDYWQKGYWNLADAVCRESTSVDNACSQARQTRAELAALRKELAEAKDDGEAADAAIRSLSDTVGCQSNTISDLRKKLDNFDRDALREQCERMNAMLTVADNAMRDVRERVEHTQEIERLMKTLNSICDNYWHWRKAALSQADATQVHKEKPT